MKAGKLRHRAQLFTPPARTPDSFGDVSSAYVPGPWLWCSIEPVSGDETFLAGGPRADVTHTVTMRYDARVTARCYLAWDGRILQLGPPRSKDERKFETVCDAVEKVT